MCHARQNGPDWTDVRVALKTIEEVHNCKCFVNVTPDGRSDGVEWLIVVAAAVEGQIGGEVLKAAAVAVTWPNVQHRTMEAAAFDAAYRLDWRIAQTWYEQRGFPF